MITWEQAARIAEEHNDLVGRQSGATILIDRQTGQTGSEFLTAGTYLFAQDAARYWALRIGWKPMTARRVLGHVQGLAAAEAEARECEDEEVWW